VKKLLLKHPGYEWRGTWGSSPENQTAFVDLYNIPVVNLGVLNSFQQNLLSNLEKIFLSARDKFQDHINKHQEASS
jgi:hypothetical protein